jgi:hypothetical protein
MVDSVTCPGSLIFHADGTIARCTEDDEVDGCRGRDERDDGSPKRCIADGVSIGLPARWPCR